MLESGLDQKCSKCYGSSEDEKVFPVGEEQGRPCKRGDIWILFKSS